MEEEISEIIETLAGIVEDLPSKPRIILEKIIKQLENFSSEKGDIKILIKVSEDLEAITNYSCVDSFSRNEITNVLSSFERLF